MLKHSQIINLEQYLKNRNPLNNLDDHVTFLYQYAWNEHSIFSWSEESSAGNHGDWPSGTICENSSSMTPYETIWQLLSKNIKQ